MRCPYCEHLDSKVSDSRPAEDGNAIRRRRECLACSKRFTTFEKVESLPLIVVKKNGQREVFDTAKLLMGVIKACEKRPVETIKLETMVDDIEKELENSMLREIPSQKIGELVMERLKDIDKVAYVRFASVYREFKDLESFAKELEELLHRN